MQSRAETVSQYLAGLPADRRRALAELRKVIRANLDPAIREGMQYGMIGYFVPHSVYPAGYHCDPKQPLPFASIASQKNHMALYLFCLYCDPQEVERFRREWLETGKRLDMGKSCVRFKRIEDVPLDVVAAAIRRMTAKRFIEFYERNIGPRRGKAPKEGGAAKKRAARKKAAGGSAKKVAKKAGKKAAKKAAKKAGKKATKKVAKKIAKKKVAKKAAKKAGK